MTPTVGVLALQGDYADHERALVACGVSTRQVRTAPQLQGLDGLVLPGGESTTMLRLLGVEGLEEPLRKVLDSGLPVFGTCAGMILLAETVEHPAQRSFGLLPITVRRNGYGRQVHSGTHRLESEVLPAGTEGIFIRAPRVTQVRPDCEVLARRDGDPVLVRKGSVLAAGFHPELLEGRTHPVIQMFVESLGKAVGERGATR